MSGSVAANAGSEGPMISFPALTCKHPIKSGCTVNMFPDGQLRPAGRAPVLFEVTDQCLAEMALGLFAGVHCAVAAEDVQRLRPNAQRTTVVDGADCAGVG